MRVLVVIHDKWNADIILKDGRFAYTCYGEQGIDLVLYEGRVLIDHYYEDYFEMLDGLGSDYAPHFAFPNFKQIS